MSGSMIGTPPKVRASKADPSPKLGVMRDIIPLAATESTKWHTENGFREVTVTDEDGFQSVAPGWYVGPIREARPISGGTVDPNHPTEKIGAVYVTADGRVVRTCDMGDAALPKVTVQPTTPRDLRKRSAQGTVDTFRDATPKAPKVSNEEVEAYLAARGFTGTITPKFRTLVRDAMADEIATAAYTQGR